jgi:hypothetical protein
MLTAMVEVEESPIAIDLTERERKFIVGGLREWHGSASWVPLPIEALGMSDWDEFDALTDRLRAAVGRGEPLTELDWARVLFLSEVIWGSSLVGAALDFEIVTGFSDAEAIAVLRSLQRKIGNWRRAKLLFPGRGRPRDLEELERESEKMLQQIRGRKYPRE